MNLEFGPYHSDTKEASEVVLKPMIRRESTYEILPAMGNIMFLITPRVSRYDTYIGHLGRRLLFNFPNSVKEVGKLRTEFNHE